LGTGTSVSGVPRLVQNSKTNVEDMYSTNSVSRASTADQIEKKEKKDNSNAASAMIK